MEQRGVGAGVNERARGHRQLYWVSAVPESERATRDRLVGRWPRGLQLYSS